MAQEPDGVEQELRNGFPAEISIEDAERLYGDLLFARIKVGSEHTFVSARTGVWYTFRLTALVVGDNHADTSCALVKIGDFDGWSEGQLTALVTVHRVGAVTVVFRKMS